MIRRRLLGIGLVGVVAVAGPLAPGAPAGAATITVTTTEDVVDGSDGVISLREAISAAGTGTGEDQITLGSGLTYQLTLCDGPGEENLNGAGDLDHRDPSGVLRIVGSDTTIEQTCVDDDERVLEMRGTGGLFLEGLTITGGDAGSTAIEPVARGGGVYSDSWVSLDHVILTGNRVGSPASTIAQGGGLYVGGALDMRDSSAIDNEAGAGLFATSEGSIFEGGGIYATYNVLTNQSHIDGNHADNVGAGLMMETPEVYDPPWLPPPTVTLNATTLDQNTARNAAAVHAVWVDHFGGSVDDNAADETVIEAAGYWGTNTTLSRNTSGSLGVLATASASFFRTEIEDNVGPRAIYIGEVAVPHSVDGDGKLSLGETTVANNHSWQVTIEIPAGELAVNTVEVLDSTITDNDGTTTQPGWGSAGLYSGWPIVVLRSTISGNAATGAGTAAFAGVRTTRNARVVDTAIADNVAPDGPRAGLMVGGDAEVSGSTVAGNEAFGATGSRAGLVQASSSELELTRSTVAANQADEAGVIGGIAVVTGVTVSGNVGGLAAGLKLHGLEIAASALEGVGPVCDLPSGAVSGGGNVVATEVCDLRAPTDRTRVDTLGLAGLADNGGPTPTMLPLAGSSVLHRLPDADPFCTGKDQRGISRPGGSGCDAGAVEVGAAITPSFTDIAVSHPFFLEIECLAALGVAEGFPDSTFRPGRPITRQAVVAWLWRMAGEPVAPPSAFSDVPADHPFAAAISWAADADVAAGYPDGTFRPGEPVARQAVAAWLYRMDDPAPLEDPGPTFTDVPPHSPFRSHIEWLAYQGVATGYDDGTFRPVAPITRQGLAAWVCRYDHKGYPD